MYCKITSKNYDTCRSCKRFTNTYKKLKRHVYDESAFFKNPYNVYLEAAKRRTGFSFCSFIVAV